MLNKKKIDSNGKKDKDTWKNKQKDKKLQCGFVYHSSSIQVWLAPS